MVGMHCKMCWEWFWAMWGGEWGGDLGACCGALCGVLCEAMYEGLWVGTWGSTWIAHTMPLPHLACLGSHGLAAPGTICALVGMRNPPPIHRSNASHHDTLGSAFCCCFFVPTCVPATRRVLCPGMTPWPLAYNMRGHNRKHHNVSPCVCVCVCVCGFSCGAFVRIPFGCWSPQGIPPPHPSFHKPPFMAKMKLVHTANH